MLDRTALTDLSLELANSLLSAYPDWEPFPNNLDDGLFETRVPKAGTSRHLSIRTLNSQLGIELGYGRWASHWGPFLGFSNTEAVEQVMEEIRAVLAEERLFLITFQDGTWVRSACVQHSMPLAIPPGGITYVYSWRGTYDRTISEPY